MSLLNLAERIIAARFPKPIVTSLQRLKRQLPTKLTQSPPIVQTYINDGVTRSYVSVHNFYSCLLPETITDADVELTFYAGDGRRVLTHRQRLAHFGSEAVDVAELFRRHGVSSPLGIVTVQATPTHPRRVVYREIGLVAAHFFMFYLDDGSLAQVHPLSNADRAVAPGGPFQSSQVISTAGLDSIVLFQYNPGRRAHTLEHRLLDADTREIVARRRTKVAALGACRVAFTLADITPLPPRLLLAIDDLPSPNGKPMLRRVFRDGLHSMSHS